MRVVIGLWTVLRALLFGSTAIALENLALRHQLAVLQGSVPRPRLSRGDRILWVWLLRVWANWRSSLVIVQPATVLAWHRQGFQLYWRWKSKTAPVGRPRLDAALRQLIRRMARENPTRGRRRIQTFSGSCQAVFFERCRSCCRAIVARWYCSSYGTWRSHRMKMIFSHLAPNARRASRCS